MPWNGAGTYTLPPAYSPEVNGTIIDATRYNGLTTDVATGISNAIAKDGQNVPIANLPMGGFKHTGAADGVAAGQYLVYAQATAAALSSLSLSSNFSVTGTTSLTGALTASGTAVFNGGVTLGDASGDALTINSAAVSIPNGLNFDSNTLVIDAGNNRVGVGIASPTQPLDVVGGGRFSGRVTNIGTGLGFYIDSSNSGALNYMQVNNTSATVSSDSAFVVSVTGAGGGDPYFLLSNSVTNWTHGLDNSDSDSYVFSSSSALGTSNVLRMASSGAITIPGTLGVTGAITASAGVVGSLTGNAATATALQTARTINGTSFDGTANITVTAAAGTLTGATLAAGVTASSLTSLGTLGSLSVSGATSVGGQVTSSVSGLGFYIDSTNNGGLNYIQVNNISNTANSDSAVILSGAGASAGDQYVRFANSVVNWSHGLDNSDSDAYVISANPTLGTANALRISTAGAVTIPGTLGVTGAITGALTGNASTATTLQTARNINGVSFNGSADITVTAAAGTLTGATLAAGVTASSLTSVGTLGSLTVSGAAAFNGTVALGDASGDIITLNGTFGGGGRLSAGTYTPTVTAITNCTSPSALTCQFTRINDIVHVFGQATVSQTAANSLVVFHVSLPVASNITTTGDLIGVASTAGVVSTVFGYVTGDTTNDRAVVSYQTSATGSMTVPFSFSYIVQ